MKKIVLLVLLLFIFTASNYSQTNEFGLGIIAGEPTGISAKYWTGSTSAFDAAIAWSFIDGGALHLHADYILHNFNLIPVSPGKLPFYYGIGARVKFLDEASFGVRVPLGLAYIFDDAPIDVFLELVPLLDLIPKTNFRINAAIGARYYFNNANN